jgi:hypothetical protein
MNHILFCLTVVPMVSLGFQVVFLLDRQKILMEPAGLVFIRGADPSRSGQSVLDSAI